MYEKQKKSLVEIIPTSLSGTGCLVAGGALTSIFTKSEVNDIDCYFNSESNMLLALIDLTTDSWFIKFVSKKAITLVRGEEKIQLIFYKYFNTPDDIFNEFDFSINMAAYDVGTKTLTLDSSFLHTLASRTVEFNSNTPYPIISSLRTRKYSDRGYSFQTNDFIKLGLSISKLNITSWEELEDQLGGVYGELCLTDDDKKSPFSLDLAIQNLTKYFKIKIDNDKDITEDEFTKITGIVPPADVIFPTNTFNLGLEFKNLGKAFL